MEVVGNAIKKNKGINALQKVHDKFILTGTGRWHVALAHMLCMGKYWFDSQYHMFDSQYPKHPQKQPLHTMTGKASNTI